MKASFIDKFILTKKVIVDLNIEQLDARPEAMGVFLSLSLYDLVKSLSYDVGEKLRIKVGLSINMYDHEYDGFDPAEPDDAAAVFKCRLSMLMEAEIAQKVEFEKLPTELYTTELLSLIYDDFRLIIEDAIGKSDFRGFHLPIDFRQLLAHQKPAVSPE